MPDFLEEKNIKQFHYQCKDCGFNFDDTEEIDDPSCPRCCSSLLQEIVGLAGLWFLGDWLDIRGDD